MSQKLGDEGQIKRWFQRSQAVKNDGTYVLDSLGISLFTLRFARRSRVAYMETRLSGSANAVLALYYRNNGIASTRQQSDNCRVESRESPPASSRRSILAEGVACVHSVGALVVSKASETVPVIY